MITLGSLFNGLGGWELAAIRAGITPVWSSEVEKLPLAVEKERFPDVKQLGDITELRGQDVEPVDIITMGSPCQNLSVSGNRKGLEGNQSRLFLDAIKLVREMRQATNGRFPRYVVWENVTGAFSTNKGLDFRAVLESFTATSVPVPGRRWAKAGMVRCKSGTLGWRTLDAQYWGVPQHRQRVFIVNYFGQGGQLTKYYLSPRACQGILRRAEKRNKQLPLELLTVLKRQALS